jgi:hypothetical protein
VVRDRGKFTTGVWGLGIFFVALALWLSPVIGGKSGLQWADNFFNQLSKSSSYFLPQMAKNAEGYRGKIFEARVTAKDPAVAQHIAQLFAGAGAQINVNASQVFLRGDLGAVGEKMIADAQVMYENREHDLEAKYGFPGREVVYCWWVAVDAIYQQYVAAGDVASSAFASALKTKVCEPAYNFAGITPRRASDAAWPLFALLAFYLCYTLWYGFSILYVFEGLGITVQAQRRKEQ